MKISVKKSDIMSGLGLGADILPSKVSSESNRVAWLVAEDGKVRVVCNGGDSGFTGKYDAKVEAVGKIGVNGKGLAMLLGKMPSGDIQIDSTDGKTATITCGGRVTSRIPMVDNSWFNDIVTADDKPSGIISGNVLASAISRTSSTIADESMEALGCLFIGRGYDGVDGKIDICSLDGHKFSMVNTNNPELYAIIPEKGWMIKRSYLPGLGKFLRDADFSITSDNGSLQIKNLDTDEVLFVKLYQGNYSPYPVFLAKLAKNTCRLIVDKKEILERLGRAVLFDGPNGIKFRFDADPEGNEIKISAESEKYGSLEEYMDGDVNEVVENVMFPTKDLLELINKFDSEKVSISLSLSHDPCGVSGEDDPDLVTVIMPMQ